MAEQAKKSSLHDQVQAVIEKIRPFLQADGGDIELSVRDHGVGLPGGFAAEKAETLGMILVYTLAIQLRGSVEYRSRDGTEAVLRFPAT